MATIDATDIQVYKSGSWRSLKDQRIFKNGAWRTFGVGSGIAKNGNWYVLKKQDTPEPPKPAIQYNDIRVYSTTWFNDGAFKYYKTINAQCWENLPVTSDVTITMTLKDFYSSTEKNVTVIIKKGDKKGSVDTTIESISPYIIKKISISPSKDATYEYRLTTLTGTHL